MIAFIQFFNQYRKTYMQYSCISIFSFNTLTHIQSECFHLDSFPAFAVQIFRHALRLYQQLQMRSVYTGRTDGRCFSISRAFTTVHCVYMQQNVLGRFFLHVFVSFQLKFSDVQFVLFSQHKKCRNAPQLGRFALLHSCRRWRDASGSQVSCSKSFFFLSFFKFTCSP